ATPVLRHLPRLGIVLHGDEDVARLGHAAEPEYLHRRGRPRRLDALALVVDHRPDAAVLRAADERVASLEGAFLHQDRGDGAAAAIEPRLHDGALGEAVRIGL